jgi:hypothetical protein
LEIIIPFLSIAWSGHLLDYAIPISKKDYKPLSTVKTWLKPFYYPFHNNNALQILIGVHGNLQLQLSFGLVASSIITSLLAQQMYSLTPYLYLSYDYITVLLFISTILGLPQP